MCLPRPVSGYLKESQKGSLIMVFHVMSMYSRSNKKQNTLYFNANYRTEMKLLPIIMDYCPLQLDGLKIFVGVCLHGGFQPKFNFFNANPQISQRNRKVHLTNSLEKIFHNIPNISLRIIRRKNYSLYAILKGNFFSSIYKWYG